uniref:Uncharacterized protein n=1 Tax=Ananas comosus var. bracteatus TaxID=296719 RepID=A0A6V7NSP4_ANACO|nr:unnamed protein product [Ananas comosus var. bracteatus]
MEMSRGRGWRLGSPLKVARASTLAIVGLRYPLGVETCVHVLTPHPISGDIAGSSGTSGVRYPSGRRCDIASSSDGSSGIRESDLGAWCEPEASTKLSANNSPSSTSSVSHRQGKRRVHLPCLQTSCDAPTSQGVTHPRTTPVLARLTLLTSWALPPPKMLKPGSDSQVPGDVRLVSLARHPDLGSAETHLTLPAGNWL